MAPRVPHRLRSAVAGAALAALLAACGGGGGDGGGSGVPAAACDTGARKVALRDYFDEWYFWYRLSPRPDPAGAASLDDYFQSLLYTGTDAAVPADRWSYFDTTENVDRFYGEGRTLGYGLFVAGLEVTGRPELPLFVRYVEPLSPAAQAGLARGDRILSLDGRPVAEIIAGGDFGVLTPSAIGQALAVTVATAGASRTLTLTAAIHDLVPVSRSAVVTTPSGRRVGYLMVKEMIGQAVQPVADAMTGFRSAGVTEIVLDLRYNGGGLVSAGRDIASLVAGSRAAGRTYTSLLYNDKRAATNNQSYLFTSPAEALGLQRVYLLVGERTCSASEQVASGLRPMVDVVLVGDTTCGKPVGFLPQDDGCGRTYSVVNFEAVNALNEGRWFDGLRPTCAVAEDWGQPLGVSTEPLLATALAHADGAACIAPAGAAHKRALGLRGRPRIGFDGERPAMIPR